MDAESRTIKTIKKKGNGDTLEAAVTFDDYLSMYDTNLARPAYINGVTYFYDTDISIIRCNKGVYTNKLKYTLRTKKIL